MGTGHPGEDGTLVQILVEPELKLARVPVTTHVRITVAQTVQGAVATPRPVMYRALVSERTIINCLATSTCIHQSALKSTRPLQAMELRIIRFFKMAILVLPVVSSYNAVTHSLIFNFCFFRILISHASNYVFPPFKQFIHNKII